VALAAAPDEDGAVGTSVHEGLEELAVRTGGGVEVALLWSRGDGRVSVSVRDTLTAASFELEVAGEDALEAFYRPFGYAALRGIDLREAAREPIVVRG
jgi:hypothetical protein